MHTSRSTPVLVLGLFLGGLAAACRADPPAAPTVVRPPVPEVVQPPPAGARLKGSWIGTSTTVETHGLPECRPSTWTEGGEEPIQVDVSTGSLAYPYRLRLIEPLSGTNCELLGTNSAVGLTAWGGDPEMSWPLDLDACGKLIDTSAWQCPTSRPHVWYLDSELNLRPEGEEALGEMVVHYAYSFVDPWDGHWTESEMTRSIQMTRPPQAP